MLKQVSRTLIVFAVLLALASPAWANSVNVILDDPTPVGGGGSPYQLLTTGPYSVAWQSCGNPPVPIYEPASTYTDCLALLNNLNTGGPITTFELMITVPTALNGDTLSCLNPDGTTNNCGTIGPLVAGNTVTLTFSGLDIPINTEFFVGLSGPDVTTSDVPNPTVSLPTNDPSTLVLLAVGMGMLAMCGARRFA